MWKKNSDFLGKPFPVEPHLSESWPAAGGRDPENSGVSQRNRAASGWIGSPSAAVHKQCAT